MRKFSKIFKKFLKKIAKNALFLPIFPNNLANHALIFCAFGRKTQFVGNFEKFFKMFLKKIAKMHCFSLFFQKFNKPCVKFLRAWSKNTIYWKFSKFITFAYFPNFLTDHAFIFCAFGRKTQKVGNFGKIFKFSKKFIRKLRKRYYFSIFFKKLNKPCVKFLRV